MAPCIVTLAPRRGANETLGTQTNKMPLTCPPKVMLVVLLKFAGVVFICMISGGTQEK